MRDERGSSALQGSSQSRGSGGASGLSVGSLFSGIGGFDLGLERAGHRVVWQVEFDARCRSVLRRHWPAVNIYEDVCHVGRSTLALVDLVCGGFPCQDLSVAGRRAGLDGERSGLWFEFHRIVSELLPTWVLVENVPGLRSSAGGRDLAVILRGLAELGYLGAWRSLDSQYLGVAQRRERIFLLACRDPGAGCPAEVLALAEGLSGNPAPSRATGARVAGTLEARAATGGYDPGAHGAASGHIVAFALKASGGNQQDDHETYITHSLTADGFDASEDGTGRGTPIVAFDTTQITSGENRSDPQPGDPCHPLAAGAHPPAIAPLLEIGGGTSSRGVGPNGAGIGEPGDPMYTLQAGKQHGIGATIPRRLTPTECERLQGFPDGWTALDSEGRTIADGPRYRMLGNAVTVNVAEWIGHRLALPPHSQNLAHEPPTRDER